MRHQCLQREWEWPIPVLGDCQEGIMRDFIVIVGLHIGLFAVVQGFFYLHMAVGNLMWVIPLSVLAAYIMWVIKINRNTE